MLEVNLEINKVINEPFGWGGRVEASYLHSGLDEVQSNRQGLPHEDVWVLGGPEGLLQLLQLPAAVVGPRPPLLHRPLLIWRHNGSSDYTGADGRQPTNGSKLGN